MDEVEVQFKVESPNEVELFLIRVPRAKRERGLGTRILSEIVRLADTFGITLRLEPSPADDYGPGLGALVGWYERFCFVPDEDYQNMVRLPGNGKG